MSIFRPLLITLTLGATLVHANPHRIFYAIEGNNLAAVRELLKQGADVNISVVDLEGFSRYHSWNRSTPLSFASKLGHVDIIKILLEYNADIEGTTVNGDTPLMTASFCGKTNAIKTLLNHGAHINAQNKQGQTALMMAVENADEYSVSLLLEHNPDLTLRDKNNWTVLTYAQKTLSRLELEAHYAYYDNNYNNNSHELSKCDTGRSIIEILKAHGATE